MSPLGLRRYRAERLLRREFEALRGGVTATVGGRLRGSGMSLDTCDLEACYAEAWQGLYMAVLDGQEIANPAGWLVLVTYRRAIDEHRARGRAHRGGEWLASGVDGPRPLPSGEVEGVKGAHTRDLATELDDRVRLRHLFEGLSARLNGREREAAVLCYLQGLSRSQAAARMGVSEARMRKLMEGRGVGRPGVAGKVGALVETIRDGGWCEEQGSLMRGLAYGILDPDGERYRLALVHRSECPACRAYVASLRGLAAALPPLLPPWGLGAGVLARVGDGAHVGASTAGVQASRGLGPTLSGSGAAGAGAGGAAGGSWLLVGGPLGAKLAVGCVLAVGVGAGCIALGGGGGGSSSARPHHSAPAFRTGYNEHSSSTGHQVWNLAFGARQSAAAPARGHLVPTTSLTPAGRASREFGPEQGPAPSAPQPLASTGPRAPTARSASTGSEALTGAGPYAGGSPPAVVPPSAGGGSAPRPSVGGVSQAAREFAPG